MWRQLLPLALVISLCYAGHRDDICIKGGDVSANPKDFPAIPDVFQMDIQMNVFANKTTRHLFEVFDSPNGRAIIGETEATGPYKNISLTGYDIYNFNTNQIVEVFQLPDTTHVCNASQLDGKGADTFMFGKDSTSKTGFTGKSAFMIDDSYPPVYQGVKTLDSGIITEMWSDCQYIPAMDATVKVEWYFTDSSAATSSTTPSPSASTTSSIWTSPLGVQVPVMLKVNGIAMYPNPKGRAISHTYTFVGFSDFIPDRSKPFFQVPPGTVCPHLKNFDVGKPQPHPLPPVGIDGYFSFRAEFVQQTGPGTGLVTDIREFYDSTLMMSRFDYVPKGMMAQFFTENSDHEVSEVHDFMTGLAYIQDRVHGNCTIKPLADAANFDVKGTDGNHVRMKSVAEFFGLTGTAGSSMNWTYTGQRQIRDMMADIYIAERLGFPPNVDPKVKSTWEIAFMSSSYIDVATSADLEVNEPMRIWIKIPDLDYEMSYNIYDFDENEPDTWTYRISNCYSDDQKTNVMFKLPGDQRYKIENNRKEFGYWLLVDVIGYLDLLPSRIANLEWTADDNDDNIAVRFQILDPPTVAGSTQNKIASKYMVPTADALALLQASIDKGEFVVEAGSIGDGSITPVIAVKGSLNSDRASNTVYVTEKPKVKLDAGAAAGYAIGFFVVGVGIGVLIIFIVNKVRGNNVPNMTLSFTPKTFENE